MWAAQKVNKDSKRRPSIDNRYQRSTNTLLHCYSVKRLQLGSRFKTLLGFIIVIAATGCDNPAPEETYTELYLSGQFPEAAHSLLAEWGDRELSAKRRQQIRSSLAFADGQFIDQLVKICQTTRHSDFCINELVSNSDSGDDTPTLEKDTEQTNHYPGLIQQTKADLEILCLDAPTGTIAHFTKQSSLDNISSFTVSIPCSSPDD